MARQLSWWERLRLRLAAPGRFTVAGHGPEAELRQVQQERLRCELEESKALAASLAPEVYLRRGRRHGA